MGSSATEVAEIGSSCSASGLIVSNCMGVTTIEGSREQAIKAQPSAQPSAHAQAENEHYPQSWSQNVYTTEDLQF